MRSVRLSIQWHSLVAAAFAAWLWPNDAQAASCSFTSVIGANFGTYQVFDVTPLDSTGSITVLCSGVLPTDLITIEIDGGSSSNPANRYMLNGLISLNYNLYLDPSRMLIWGNGANGTSVLGPLAIADQTPTTWTVYGRISPMQNVSAGNYSDTVMVTVQF
jgi:spore coat protein U-like protein